MTYLLLDDGFEGDIAGDRNEVIERELPFKHAVEQGRGERAGTPEEGQDASLAVADHTREGAGAVLRGVRGP